MKNSTTFENLARSFAGESQAGLRYQIIADMCMQQGYNSLADELKTIAKNEVQHAKTYYHLLTENGGSADNIDICAGYPFEKITIEDGLREAMLAEKEEADKVYPEFAKIARNEGFTGIAKKFELTAKVEKEHELKFKYLYESFKTVRFSKRNSLPTGNVRFADTLKRGKKRGMYARFAILRRGLSN